MEETAKNTARGTPADSRVEQEETATALYPNGKRRQLWPVPVNGQSPLLPDPSSNGSKPFSSRLLSVIHHSGNAGLAFRGCHSILFGGSLPPVRF